MEAVRLRKENQIYSADEKRALAMFRWDKTTVSFKLASFLRIFGATINIVPIVLRVVELEKKHILNTEREGYMFIYSKPVSNINTA